MGRLAGRLGVLRATDGTVLIEVTPGFVSFEIGLTFDHGSAHLQITVDPSGQVEQLAVVAGPPTRLLGQ
jgi:hypothetical protein